MHDPCLKRLAVEWENMVKGRAVEQQNWYSIMSGGCLLSWAKHPAISSFQSTSTSRQSCQPRAHRHASTVSRTFTRRIPLSKSLFSFACNAIVSIRSHYILITIHPFIPLPDGKHQLHKGWESETLFTGLNISLPPVSNFTVVMEAEKRNSLARSHATWLLPGPQPHSVPAYVKSLTLCHLIPRFPAAAPSRPLPTKAAAPARRTSHH